MVKHKKITNLGKYLNEVKLAEMKEPKVVPKDKVPEQYIFTHLNALSKTQPYPNIISKCMKQLLKHKLVIKNSSCYRDELINACTNYSKTAGGPYNIRKKCKILELNDSNNKLSNFLVLSVGSIHNCLDDTTYCCYYITTIEKYYDAIIAVPQAEPDHAKAIEDKLNALNLLDKFELCGDFKQVYNFGLQFNAFASKQKDEAFRRFIPADYKILENKEYTRYLNEIKRREAHDRVDKEFDELEEPCCEEQTEPQAEEEPTPDTHTEPSIYTPDILAYDDNCNVYQSLNNLFELCDSKTMLFLLGFFMKNAVPQLSDKQNAYSLALISPTKEQAYVKKICDILHRLVFNEARHPSVQFDVVHKIKYYFKESNYSIPTVITTDNFNKEDSKKFSHALKEYYENKPNKQKDSLIIIAKKDFDCNYLHKITCNAKESAETEKAMKALKADSFFGTTIKDFLQNIKSRYSTREFRYSYDYDACEQDNAELIRGEISKKIHELSNTYTLTYEDAVKYAPVIYFLEEYFTYLMQSQAINQEQYGILNQKLKEVYSLACDGDNNTPKDESEPTPEEISEILLSCVAEAYTNNKIPDDTNGDFYIYKNNDKGEDLICFTHQQESPLKCIVNLIEENGMGDKISDIKEFALKPSIGDGIKRLWKATGITHAKSGLLYSTRKGKVIALISKNIKAYYKS